MRYKVIAVVVAVVVVAAAGAATLVDRTPTMRYVAQHEDTSVPRADAPGSSAAGVKVPSISR